MNVTSFRFEYECEQRGRRAEGMVMVVVGGRKFTNGEALVVGQSDAARLYFFDVDTIKFLKEGN